MSSPPDEQVENMPDSEKLGRDDDVAQEEREREGQEGEERLEAEEEHLFDDDIEMQDSAEKKKNGDHDDGEQDQKDDKLPSANELSDEDIDPENPPEDSQQETLFSSIYTTPACVPGLVSTWMAHIQTNGPAAVASILSLVVSVSRAIEAPSPDIIPPEAVIANEPAETISEVRETISSDRHGRVIITAKDTWSRRIRRAYEDFWRRIAAEATDVVLYDTDCFDTLITWLDAMASSPSRSLRLAACLGAYRLVDGFVEMGNKIRKQLASMQRQLNTEKRRCGVDDKRRKGKLSQKGKDLVKKVDDLTANNSELIELSDKVFRTLFIVKYRDVSPDIRNASVAALAGWILSFPDHFLDDSNNKYIGWLLSDKDPVVRKSSIDALLRMLKKKEFFASLELFLKRFSDRIVEMTRDKDDHVSVGAITLLTNLIEHGMVEGDACEHVCDTAIEETHTEIRRAAGEFMSKLISNHYGNAGQRPLPKRGRAGRTSDGVFNPGLAEIPSVEQSREYLKELLFAVLRKSDESAAPSLAVDAVWDSFPAVRCWQAFSDLLFETAESVPAKRKSKNSRKGKNSAVEEEDSLNDYDKSVLCEMLLASATEASGNGDATRAKLVEKGERLHPEPPAVLLSQHFLPLLPKLLSQFQTDPRALCALVKLPIHFSPKCFDQDGQDTHFTTLLTKIIDVLTRNTGSPEVSSACAETLRSLLSDHNPLKQHTITALQAGCTDAAKDLTLQVRSDLSKAQPHEIASAILRVRILSELVDPGSSLQESVLKLFEHQVEHVETSELGDDVTNDAARTASALAIWSLARVRSRLESLEDPEGGVDGILELEEVKDLRRLGSSVVDLLHRAFASPDLPIASRVNSLQAFLTMCTLARGIERYVLSSVSGQQPVHDAQTPASRDFDLLSIQGSVLTIVAGLKKCVAHLMEHQLELTDHSLLSSQNQRRKIYPLPDEDVRNCLASLVQSSFQSAFSSEISHLPLVGLLLRRNQQDLESTSADFTAFQLCRKYCQQRQLRESSLIKDEVRILRQAAKFEVADEHRCALVRELAEALLSSRQHGKLKITAAHDLLTNLMEPVTTLEESELTLNIEIVCSAGFALCAYLSQANATSLLGKSKEIKKKVGAMCEEDESSEIEQMFDTFHQALEAVSVGETPNIPKHHIRSVVQRKRKRTKKRRRTSPGSARLSQSPAIENRTVRRSSREKKHVNYAKMQGLQSEAEDDAEEEESSQDEEQETSGTTKPSPPQDAAEMARNLMRFGSSPRPSTRDAPEVPKNALNPRKRGRPSRQRKSVPLDSASKSASESPHLDAAAGLRRSSRTKRSSAKALASQEGDGTGVESQSRITSQAEKESSLIETNGLQAENEHNIETGTGTEPEENATMDKPAPRSGDGEVKEDETNNESIEEPEGFTPAQASSAPSQGSEVEKPLADSPRQQGREGSPSGMKGDEPKAPEPAIASSSASPSEKEAPGTLNTPSPKRTGTSRKTVVQTPRRSPRKLSSASKGSSQSPAKGRVQKSPGSSKGQSSSFSQGNKENVNGRPLKADDVNARVSKIRRRRRRQW